MSTICHRWITEYSYFCSIPTVRAYPYPKPSTFRLKFGLTTIINIIIFLVKVITSANAIPSEFPERRSLPPKNFFVGHLEGMFLLSVRVI